MREIYLYQWQIGVSANAIYLGNRGGVSLSFSGISSVVSECVLERQGAS
jgi:hypothetical protein